jgi:ABC-type nickel/cobalt efflux system permease component RcnA
MMGPMSATALLAIAWTGFLAGAVHVVTGADHMAALLPLSVGRRFRAFAVGARWGVGHSAGVLLIALLAVLLRERMNLELVGAWGERLVGVMLVALGILGIREALRLRIHAHGHDHEHTQAGHVHLHLHGPATAHVTSAASGAPLHRHAHTAFAAGTLHGVAGTAHVLGVLPAVAMPNAAASGAYLAAFALGTILAMGSFSAIVGETSARASSTTPRLLKSLMYAAGTLTILVGLAWIAIAFGPVAHAG